MVARVPRGVASSCRQVGAQEHWINGNAALRRTNAPERKAVAGEKGRGDEEKSEEEKRERRQ